MCSNFQRTIILFLFLGFKQRKMQKKNCNKVNVYIFFYGMLISLENAIKKTSYLLLSLHICT